MVGKEGDGFAQLFTHAPHQLQTFTNFGFHVFIAFSSSLNVLISNSTNQQNKPKG
jgi:hypothetical protein